MKTVKFSLKDSEGQSHQYEVELFSCDENARLQLIVSKPLLQMIGSVIAALVPAIADGVTLDDLDAISGMLSKIDWLSAPGALTPLPEMIEERGGPDLVARIFERTARLLPVPELQGATTATGDAAIDPNLRLHLKLASARDEAFGDGNMAEYWAAAAMVLIVNFTKLGRSELIDWKQLVERLTGGILKPSKTSTREPRKDSAKDNPPLTH